RADEGAGAAVASVAAVLPHAAVHLTLRLVEPDHVVRRDGGGGHHLLLHRLADARGVPPHGDLDRVVVLVGDRDRELLRGGVVRGAEAHVEGLVVEIDRPELAADVGRIAGGALARGHALAARAGEARGAGLDEAAAGAVLVALPDLVLLLAGAVGRARHADAAAAVVVATAARSAAAVPAARKGARDERAQQPRASH